MQGEKEVEVVTSAAVGGNVLTNEKENELEIAGVLSLVLKKNKSGLRLVSGNLSG